MNAVNHSLLASQRVMPDLKSFLWHLVRRLTVMPDQLPGAFALLHLLKSPLPIPPHKYPLLPCLPPHVRPPPALVHLDNVEIGQQCTIILQAVLLDALGNVDIRLIVMPPTLAHETIENQDLLRIQPTPIRVTP